MFGFYDSYFTFFGLDITYYGFIIALGMAIGVFVACKNAKFRGLKTDDLLIIACYVLPLSIIGARIYYVIFSLEEFDSFWDIFKIWEGGMAIYGGVIGGALGIVLYCLIHKKNFLDVGDIAAPSLVLGQAIGRIGCYFAGCCYGIAVTDPSLTWFPLSTQIDGVWHLSTFFYESIWDLMTFVILFLLLRKDKLKYRGSIIYLYFIIYGTGRAWIEALRGDSLYLGSIKVSQLLSILLIAFGIIMLVVTEILHRKGKIKTLKDLKPQYALNIQSELEEKAKKKAKKEERKQNKIKKAEDSASDVKIEGDVAKQKVSTGNDNNAASNTEIITDAEVSKEAICGEEGQNDLSEEEVIDKKENLSSKNDDKKDNP